GEDPDSLVRNRGAQAMDRILSDAVSFVDFKGEMLKAQGLLSTPEGQAEAVRSLVDTISKVPDHIRRDFMIRAVAFRFELNEQMLYTELSGVLRKRTLSVRTTPPRHESGQDRKPPAAAEQPENAVQKKAVATEQVAQPGLDLLPE